MRTALVLGGGGAAGWLYHAGVVRALGDLGWDAAGADLIIGTSAGAAVAAGLRYGASADEFVASILRGPSDEERAEFRRQMEGRSRSYRPLSASLARHALPGGAGIGVAVAGMLPRGFYPTNGLGRFPGVNGHRAWPAGLWIPAVRVSDGELVVFGRDRRDVAVHDAVEASSAVPGLFAPKDIDGEAYVDGGVGSPTHADLAAEARPDLVVVSSPMTRPSRQPLHLLARRRLAAELADLEREGIATIVVEPAAGAEVFGGFPRSSPEKAPLILEEAARATLAAAAASPLAAA